MADLRWVLLLFGLVILGGIFLWSKFRSRRPDPSPAGTERREPAVDSSRGAAAGSATPASPGAIPGPQKIVTVRLMCRSRAGFAGEELILALRDAGLKHGRFGIFHGFLPDAGDAEPVFSAASLVEPGSFDLTTLRTAAYPGISLFMALPGPADGVVAFDAMVAAARGLAGRLDADLLDEQGSTLSVQRERYLREEVIQFQHRQGAPG